jgi:hypothetical protein
MKKNQNNLHYFKISKENPEKILELRLKHCKTKMKIKKSLKNIY